MKAMSPARPTPTLPPYRMEGGCRTRPVTSVISSLTMIPNSRTYGSVLKLALRIYEREQSRVSQGPASQRAPATALTWTRQGLHAAPTSLLISSCRSGADLAVALIMVEV